VHGKRVSCPLHDWKINLDTGVAVAPDEGCAVSFPIKLEGDIIYLLPVASDGCPNNR
jgi:nitrite reductase (NADH) small subunit